MTTPLFSTMKTKSTSFHSAVGHHSSVRWIEYSIVTVEWQDGRVTRHLQAKHIINGIIDSMSQYGTTDTERMLLELEGRAS